MVEFPPGFDVPAAFKEFPRTADPPVSARQHAD
jgi:hypothetical protein